MKKPNVIHVLANGQRVETIEGKVIPEDNPVYEILFRAVTQKGEKWEKNSIAG